MSDRPAPTHVNSFGQPRWTIGIVGASTQGIAIDSAGDVLAGGGFRGTADFGAGPIATQTVGGAGWFGKRAGADGSYLWSITLDTSTSPDLSNGTQVADIKADDDANVIITGTYSGTVDFGGVTLNGDAAYIAKYDRNGQLVWVHDFRSGSGHDIAVGHDGRIYVLGFCYTATITFPNGSVPCTSPNVPPDMVAPFVVALEPDGTFRWGHAYPAGLDIAIMSTGDLVLTGDLNRDAKFGNQIIQPTSSNSQFAVRLTADGDVSWGRVIGTMGVSYSNGELALDRDNIVQTSNAYPAAGPSVAMLDQDGHEVWRSAPTIGLGAFLAVAVSPIGTVITAGTTPNCAINFGSGPIIGCIYLAAYGSDGTFWDARGFGDTTSAGVIRELAPSVTGALAFGGDVTQPTDFGTGAVSGAVIGVLDPP